MIHTQPSGSYLAMASLPSPQATKPAKLTHKVARAWGGRTAGPVHTALPTGEQRPAARVVSHKGGGLGNGIPSTTLELSPDLETAMMTGPENLHTSLHTTDSSVLRITAMKSNKVSLEKVQQRKLYKTGNGPGENQSFEVSATFPERKEFMQVGKAGSFPALCSWLSSRQKILWTCSISMYPRAPPAHTHPQPGSASGI